MSVKLVHTSDGSHTLYAEHLKEHYHSTFGAITESKHIFINAGFNSIMQKDIIAIFEVGFGTGLNALLTSMEAMHKDCLVHYYAIENFPIDPDIVNKLNYVELLGGNDNISELFFSLHHVPWNQDVLINRNFKLHKIHNDLTTYAPHFSYDLIYFDAFAPEKQPEMWTGPIFSGLFKRLNPGGILTTYCVKGSVKRMLKQAGFDIEKLPGPPGKREILRGIKRMI